MLTGVKVSVRDPILTKIVTDSIIICVQQTCIKEGVDLTLREHKWTARTRFTSTSLQTFFRHEVFHPSAVVSSVSPGGFARQQHKHGELIPFSLNGFRGRWWASGQTRRNLLCLVASICYLDPFDSQIRSDYDPWSLSAKLCIHRHHYDGLSGVQCRTQ